MCAKYGCTPIINGHSYHGALAILLIKATNTSTPLLAKSGECSLEAKTGIADSATKSIGEWLQITRRRVVSKQYVLQMCRRIGTNLGQIFVTKWRREASVSRLEARERSIESVAIEVIMAMQVIERLTQVANCGIIGRAHTNAR